MNYRYFPSLFVTVLLVTVSLLGPAELTAGKIRNGFFIKVGPSLPLGSYKDGQLLYGIGPYNSPYVYEPAKTGFVWEMGTAIYTGPAFIKEKMRIGIEYTFLNFSTNSVNYYEDMDDPRYYYWYAYVGQKIGPVITLNPIDRLMFDFSYQMNAYIGFKHHWNGMDYIDEWGENLTQSEISASIRYAAMIVSFQYNFGHINYNNLDFSNPDHKIDNDTFRILFGVKL